MQRPKTVLPLDQLETQTKSTTCRLGRLVSGEFPSLCLAFLFRDLRCGVVIVWISFDVCIYMCIYTYMSRRVGPDVVMEQD